jgi:hypothetical protein
MAMPATLCELEQLSSHDFVEAMNAGDTVTQVITVPTSSTAIFDS